MEQMVEKINSQNPDLVCIAGDIFDNDYDALYEPEKLIEIFKSIDSKYGVYACYGNHDISEKILGGFTFRTGKTRTQDDRMEEFLSKAGINLLTDKSVLVDDAFYIVGRRDYEKPGIEGERKSIAELTENLDKSKPIIVIDNEPKELQEKADSGVDIDLGGHTHNGQMFPGNLTIKLLWENPAGCIKKDDMYSIVTSGVGVWGPNMRVGTDSEIVSIDVQFSK